MKNIKTQVYLFFYLSLIVIMALNFSGCSCSGENTAATSSSATGQAAKKLTLAIPSDLTATDPALSSDVTSGQVLSKVFEKLINLNNDLVIIPELADTFEIASNCTEFKFTLKKGVLFSD
nr:hypothetical protein [Candidatus Wallbacteria bacterium]